jgi:hypothetical protein
MALSKKRRRHFCFSNEETVTPKVEFFSRDLSILQKYDADRLRPPSVHSHRFGLFVYGRGALCQSLRDSNQRITLGHPDEFDIEPNENEAKRHGPSKVHAVLFFSFFD